MSHVANDQWFEDRGQFVEDVGGKDILVDDKGLEYTLTIREEGNPGDDYDVMQVKRYLPDNLQTKNQPDDHE